MSRLTAYFRTSRSLSASPKEDDIAFTNTQAAQLRDAFSKLTIHMNGNADKAWELLQQPSQTSSSSTPDTFHLYASSLVIFFRAVMGFEKAIMTEAQAVFAQTEAQATADWRKAQKRTGLSDSAGRAGVYAAGTEYELIRAEVQLMAAVVGVLHESLMEAMMGFNKVRKAYAALSVIAEAEKKGLKRVADGIRKSSSQISVASKSSPLKNGTTAVEKGNGAKEDSDFEVVDGNETESETQTPDDASSVPIPSESVNKFVEEDYDTSCLTHPVDIFIHSGVNLCFGFLIFALTLIPPSFSKILSIVGFHGNRPVGLSMVWRAAAMTALPPTASTEKLGEKKDGTNEEEQANVHAALAAMALFAYYNVMLSTVEVLPPPSEVLDDPTSQAVGPPLEKLDALLKEVRRRYPDSPQWVIEEARRKSLNGRVREAIALLQAVSIDEEKTKQITALRYFELTLQALLAQEWDLMRSSALKSLELNEWSPCVYIYLAGSASLELYRDALHAGDADTARREKEKTEKLFREAPTRAGKKKFLARQLPIEVFITARLQKWEARLKKWQGEGVEEVGLADAIGPSPALEFGHIWNGGKRMVPSELEGVLKTLDWSRLTAPPEKKVDIENDLGDQGVQGLIRGAALKQLGRIDEGRALLNETVLDHPQSNFKVLYAEDMIYPQALNEVAAQAWKQCIQPPFQVGDSKETLPEDVRTIISKGSAPSATAAAAADGSEEASSEATVTEGDLEVYQKAKTEECETYLLKVKNYGAFSLDARIGMSVASALETLKWWRGKKGWTK